MLLLQRDRALILYLMRYNSFHFTKGVSTFAQRLQTRVSDTTNTP